MILSRKLVFSVGLLALAGCLTIHSAREAQRELAPRGDDAGVKASAGPVDLRGRSLAELVDFALTNRPSVVAAALDVVDARLALKQLAADAPILSDTPWTVPHLSVSGGHSESSASARRFDSLRSRTHGKASASLSLDLLIWDWGLYNASARAQAENVIAAELAFLNAGYAVFEDVSSAYFTALEKDALLQVAQTNEFMFAEHLRQAKEQMEAGEGKKLDVLKAELDLSQAREKTVAAELATVTAGAELLKSLGLDVATAKRSDVLVARDDALSSVLRGFPDTSADVVAAFDFARTNSPTMRISRARLRGASAQVDRAIADLMPEVNASVSLGWADPLWVWQWGVNGVQSLFQGFRKTTAVDRAVVAMQTAAADVDAEEQRLSLDLALAVAERDGAREARETARASVHEARLNLETVEQQFRLGAASRVEFSDAVASLSAALGNRVSAFYRGQRAEAALFALLGADPDFREEEISEDKR